MTTTAWAHLPNAKHIDRILADLRLRPQAYADAYAAWDAARDAAWVAARGADWVAARGAACDAARSTARGADWVAVRGAVCIATRGAASGAARDAARDAVQGAIAALIVWDDCAYILDLHPDVVRSMAASGNHPAILLEAAVIAMHG